MKRRKVYVIPFIAVGILGIVGILLAGFLHKSLPIWLQYGNAIALNTLVILYGMDRVWPIDTRRNR